MAVVQIEREGALALVRYDRGGKANALNATDVALPSGRLEPLTLAPLWDDLKMFGTTAQWQVKTVGALEVLIVQWTGAATVSPATTNTFQVKVWSNGQVDFEYQAIDAGVGVEERHRPDVLARLSETVDTALALFMTGGVPGQVVMHDGAELLLQVDAF